MPNEEIASLVGFSFGGICLCVMLWLVETISRRVARWLLTISSVCFIVVLCIVYSMPNTPTKMFLMSVLVGLGIIAAFSLERLKWLKRREQRYKGE